MAFTCSVHVSWIGVSEERQEVVCMAPHVLSRLSPELFKAERAAPLRQLILHSAVHAVTVRGDLFDLQVPLHQLLSQLQTLQMTGAGEILHFSFSNPDLPLLLKSSLFLLKKTGYFSVIQWSIFKIDLSTATKYDKDLTRFFWALDVRPCLLGSVFSSLFAKLTESNAFETSSTLEHSMIWEWATWVF